MDDEPSSSMLPRNEEDLVPRMGLRVASLSDLGTRHDVNEDSCAVLTDEDGSQLLILCDGMGGMGRGDVASKLAVETLSERLKGEIDIEDPRKSLTDAVRLADVVLRDKLCRGRRHPGSTSVVVSLSRGFAHVAWVGDSGAYLIRNGAVAAQTRDHRVIEGLIASGAMTREQANASPMARLLSRSIGGRGVDDPVVEVDSLSRWPLRLNDVILLCSDGVHGMLSEAELCAIASRQDPEAACKEIIDLANRRGADDNITVVIGKCIRFGRKDEIFGKAWVEVPPEARLESSEVSAMAAVTPPSPPSAIANAASSVTPSPAPNRAPPPRNNGVLIAAGAGFFGILAACAAVLTKFLGLW